MGGIGNRMRYSYKREFKISQNFFLIEFYRLNSIFCPKFLEEKILGDFKFSFVRVTHSVPDTSHIFIETPIGNFYHGSDFKLDPTPYDKNTTDFARIEELSKRGVLCLLSDSLGAERKGRTPSEFALTLNFENEIKKCNGTFIVTTYSSNIARLNQVIEASEKV